MATVNELLSLYPGNTLQAAPAYPIDIRDLLTHCIDEAASDLHLTENEPPILRVDGKLQRTSHPVCTREQLQALIYSMLTDEQQVEFERNLELDFALSLPNIDRFRVNVHRQRGAIEAAFRRVPQQIPRLQDLGLPPVVADLVRRPSGMVLVTGPTGMGKSTSMAAMVDLINSERECLIMCIEDPIEFVHAGKVGVVKQREVHTDTRSFASALRHALRQDPDVIVIGEMRDLETISIALTAAETGHLVLATLHTPDAVQTIERIIDVFPPAQQQQVQLQLANCLEGVVAQQLLPKAHGKGLVLAAEVLIATSGVRNIIRDHSIEQLPSMMQTGARHGMITMDKAIVELFKRGQIKHQIGMAKMKHPEDFNKL
ncbi:MAG: type IV pilus twitching motility protein PilT [Armatimonadota bacterium]